MDDDRVSVIAAAANDTAATTARPLRRSLALLLIIKLIALILIWALFFRPGLRVEVDGERAAEKLLSRSIDIAIPNTVATVVVAPIPAR